MSTMERSGREQRGWGGLSSPGSAGALPGRLRVARAPAAGVFGLGARGLWGAVCVVVALGLLVLPAGAQALEQRLVVPGGAAGDELGRSVAVDGDTAVVGAPFDDGGKGAVYVFVRAADSWSQTAKLTASDGAVGDQLGVSVAIDGDAIIAGAPLDDFGVSAGQGSVYTFARTGDPARTQTAKLSASDGYKYDNLGVSVAIDGDTIIASAPFVDVGLNTEQGLVYTFARTGAAARTQTAKLAADDGATGDRLGRSMAIDGDTIIAGAPSDNVDATDQGSVYIFARTGAAARTQTAKLTASDGTADDRLGDSVAIDGDTIIAGARQDQVGANAFQGSVYTFARTGDPARTQTAKLTADDGAASDELGYSVAIDGDTIITGAYGDDIDANTNQGSVYTFARTGAPARTQTAKLTASDGATNDQLGLSVAIDGDTIIAGAPFDDVDANTDQGSASIFFSPTPPPPPPPTPVPPPPPPPTPVPPPPPLLGTPPFAAKLAIARAGVLRAARRLSVLAPITARASGNVRADFHAAGRHERFDADIDSANRRIRINRRIPARQARLGTGILTLSYPGDEDTQPQEVRLRAASRKARLVADRPKITSGRLTAEGEITRRARGVVRLQLLYEPAGQPTRSLNFTARISEGRYEFDERLPADVIAQIASRRGVVHSYTLFTGYFPRRVRGEMRSFQVLPAR